MIFIYFFLVVYALAMLFILGYSLVQADLLINFFKFKRNLPKAAAPAWDELPKVTVQLPVFNEKYVVERLIDAVARFEYPKEKLEIQLLDDSTDETPELILKKLEKYPDIDFVYLHRVDRKGFKAGALREGLEVAKGEFVVIFDADFVPNPNFILKTIGHFADPEVGMVQSRWTHLNENYSLLTRLQAFALDAHFMVEQMGRNAQKAFINFNGTGGIWRKACILESGNWQDDTLTEDLDLSYRAQQKGWKFIYRPDIESPAELPPVMSAIKSQQFRWTKGGAECASKHLLNVWKLDLGLKTKIHATAHLLNSVIFIAVLLVSISSIPVFFGFYAGLLPLELFRSAAIFLIGFVVIALVYFFANLSLLNYSVKAILRFAWELPLFLSVSMGLALHNGQAVWEGLSGKKSPFIRTPKYNLSSGNKLASNAYHQFKVPVTTYFEGLLALVFISMVGLTFYLGSFEMLIFHLMLAIGYTLVSVTSFLSYRVSKAEG